MADVVGFKEKVIRACQLNSANSRYAPTSRTELIEWLGLGAGTLSARYAQPAPNLQISLERAIVMALGFGPEESEFAEYQERAWPRWAEQWGKLWRNGDPQDFGRKLEETGYFVPRAPNDPRIAALLPKIRRRNPRMMKDEGALPDGPKTPAILVARADGQYLDRLASLQVRCVRGRHAGTLIATCTFGTVEVHTEDATYLVSINRCHAEVLLRQASFEPRLENEVVASRSSPPRNMQVEREYSRLNHPSWRLTDSQPKTPLKGEYPELMLGVVRGEICGDDEASLLVHKAGFAVSAAFESKMEEGGILNSLLKYLVTEHVGEIEQRGTYLYHLSAGPILGGADD
jgi:hypothetical protein